MTTGLEFPLTWHGRVVTHAGACSAADLICRLQALGLECQVEAGNHSRAGTYVTFGVSIRFHDLTTMRAVIAALEAIDGVRMVL